MSLDTNKEIVRRAADEVFNMGDFAVVDQIYADDYVNHDPGMPDVRNRAELKRWAAGLHEAFSGFHITTDALVAEADMVVKRWHCTGTHTGTFVGIPPTGRSLNFTGTTTYRIANGKIAEVWWNVDTMTMMQQLGAIPSAENQETMVGR